MYDTLIAFHTLELIQESLNKNMSSLFRNIML